MCVCSCVNIHAYVHVESREKVGLIDNAVMKGIVSVCVCVCLSVSMYMFP